MSVLTQQNLHRSGRQCECFSGSLHSQRLAGPAVVVKANPVTDDTAGVLQRLDAVVVSALLLERADDTLDHAVLLWAVRRDELLAQPVAPHQGCVVPAGKHQVVV